MQIQFTWMPEECIYRSNILLRHCQRYPSTNKRERQFYPASCAIQVAGVMCCSKVYLPSWPVTMMVTRAQHVCSCSTFNRLVTIYIRTNHITWRQTLCNFTYTYSVVIYNLPYSIIYYHIQGSSRLKYIISLTLLGEPLLNIQPDPSRAEIYKQEYTTPTLNSVKHLPPIFPIVSLKTWL